MASTSAPPWLMAQGGERRTAVVRSGDRIGLSYLRHRRQHHHHTPRRPTLRAQHAQGDDTTAPPHTATVSARPPGTGQLSGRTHSATVRCTHHHHHGRWAAGRWRARPRARVGRQGDQPDRPPGTCLPVPASQPGTQQLDRRVPCINMQSNGHAAQLGHRFGFWNATALSTARSSLASPPITSQTGRNLPGTRKDAGQCA